MPYHSNWSGWLADRLQLSFLNYGLNCNQGILDACCDLLVLVPTALKISPTVSPLLNVHDRLPPAPLLALLGPSPRARMCKICKAILRSTPTAARIDLSTAYDNLVAAVANAARGLCCICPDDFRCDWSNGWPRLSDPNSVKEKKKGCILYHLWGAIGFTLSSGLWSFFINACPNTAIFSDSERVDHWINSALDGLEESIEIDDLMSYVMRVVSPRDRRDLDIAASSDSCTIYPTILRTLSVPSQQSVTFSVVEGQFLFERRYYRRLRTEPTRARPKARTTLQQDDMRPSYIGVYMGDPLITIREKYDFLELLCSFQFAGSWIKVDLKAVIIGYIGMRWTEICSHPVINCMNVSRHKPVSTSVASPSAQGRLGVAMTRWSPIAQFLCCEIRYQAVLQRDCCLDCAAENIPDDVKACVVVIVG